MNKLFSAENKTSGTLFESRKAAGSATYNVAVKQYENGVVL